MSISTSVPASVRRPGTFQQLDVTTNARGLVPITRRVALLGAKISAGVQAVSTPVQVFSEADADTKFGAGSELALMCRAAIKAAALYGASPEIWGVAIADPGSGAFDARTLTVTGPATASGNITFTVAGKPVVVGVANGDAQNTIATNINAALLAIAATLPHAPTVATNVVTLTARNKGVNGLDLVIGPITSPLGVSIAVASSVAGSGAYDIQPALDACVDKTYDAIALATHVSGDVTKLGTHLDLVGDPGTKMFGFGYMAEPGTLTTGTTLATAANRRDIIVATCPSFLNMPGEIASMLATTIEGEDNTVLPFNNVELPLAPPPLTAVLTGAQIETALAAGATPLSINDAQTRAKIIKAVTTQTTLNSAPFYQCAEVSVIRTLYWLMRQIDAAWRIAFPRAVRSQRTNDQVWEVTYDVLKRAEDLQRIQNVDLHKGELIVEPDANVPTRDNVAIPASVIPPLNQLVGKTTLFLE